MNFEILKQDITLGEVKDSDALKFIIELGVSGDALSEAKANYFSKAILEFAKQKDIFELPEGMVYYLENNTITARRQFENKIVSLEFDLLNEKATINASIDGITKSKEYTGTSKVSEIVKAFNAILKKM